MTIHVLYIMMLGYKGKYFIYKLWLNKIHTRFNDHSEAHPYVKPQMNKFYKTSKGLSHTRIFNRRSDSPLFYTLKLSH